MNDKVAAFLDSQPEEILLKGTYIIIRIDGRGFTPFCLQHSILRPIDDRLCDLMRTCGHHAMDQYGDIAFSFGQSDEFSFVFKKSTTLFGRKRDRLLSAIVSTFTSTFVMYWPRFFPTVPLRLLPSFDARAVLYAHFGLVRDYLSWRQADSHINSLYNYTLCVLMRTGLDGPAATAELAKTVSAEKHEILLKHGIDFSMLPLAHRRGIILIRTDDGIIDSTDDLIADAFWADHKRFLK
jgi:tRNA(His) guanylyltransferase